MQANSPDYPQSLPAAFLLWMKVALIMVVLMVMIGGLTRLTESGLSIVQWKLVSGTLPPLTQEAWEQEFAEYKQTPEFIKENYYMELRDFKKIFWLEYIHRLLGRLTGLVFLLPFLYFAVKRNLPSSYVKRMGIMLLLVCLQGGVGWYMVKSGLIDQPWVSPYRLAFHLSLAAIIFSLLFWTLQQVRRLDSKILVSGRLLRFSLIVFIAMFIQLILGAFVAGLDAGYTYNTFPLMDGQFIPPHLLMLEPWYRNFFEHIPAVQFIHRWFAFAVLALVVYQWLRFYHKDALYVLLVIMFQIALGIATLLTVIDISLASIHQLGAFALLAAQLRYIFIIRQSHPVVQSCKNAIPQHVAHLR